MTLTAVKSANMLPERLWALSTRPSLVIVVVEGEETVLSPCFTKSPTRFLQRVQTRRQQKVQVHRSSVSWRKQRAHAVGARSLRPFRQFRWRWKQPRWLFISHGISAFSILIGFWSCWMSRCSGIAGRAKDGALEAVEEGEGKLAPLLRSLAVLASVVELSRWA